ncbi:MAG TPA: GNAT family N-acetyltransferase [Planctomycetaceae bacterium]|nr:GNAT family N-acetyltransferase [Planctomycetaceae bacterium]
MVHYRRFRNTDPPDLVRLWHQCGLGRGAATGFGCDAWDLLVLSQPYFDPRGLILAWEGDRAIGFVHAGFACNSDQTGLCHETGVVQAVMVHPEHRRRGVGRELMRRAETYLKSAGAGRILAGPAPPGDAFYVGLYGGPVPCGFLQSDAAAEPFFMSIGYEPVQRIGVWQLDLTKHRNPVSYRLSLIRRGTRVVVQDAPDHATWWWFTRLGRLDTLHFRLLPKSGDSTLAEATVIGLELYVQKWRERAVGIVDVYVPEPERKKGYAQALLCEILRRIRDEYVTRVEAHASESNAPAMGLLQSLGFTQVDTGVVYRKVSP